MALLLEDLWTHVKEFGRCLRLSSLASRDSVSLSSTDVVVLGGELLLGEGSPELRPESRLDLAVGQSMSNFTIKLMYFPCVLPTTFKYNVNQTFKVKPLETRDS